MSALGHAAGTSADALLLRRSRRRSGRRLDAGCERHHPEARNLSTSRRERWAFLGLVSIRVAEAGSRYLDRHRHLFAPAARRRAQEFVRRAGTGRHQQCGSPARGGLADAPGADPSVRAANDARLASNALVGPGTCARDHQRKRGSWTAALGKYRALCAQRGRQALRPKRRGRAAGRFLSRALAASGLGLRPFPGDRGDGVRGTVAIHLWNECIKGFKNEPAPDGSFLSRLKREGK